MSFQGRGFVKYLPILMAATALAATPFAFGSVALAHFASPDVGHALQIPPGDGTGAAWCAKYGVAGTTAPYSFDDVYACSPTTTKGPTPFDNDGTQSFQCVELSLRFMWAIYGVSATGIGDGADLVSDVHQQHKSISVGTPGPGSVPSAGDVASMGPGPPTNSTSGHTAVVISSNASTGQFTVMSQDWPEPDAGEQTWKIDLSGGHNGQAEIYGEWTSVSWLNLSNKTTLDLTAVFDSEKTSGQPPQEDIYWQGSNGDLWETSWVPSAGSGGTRYGPADLGIAVGSDLTAVFDSEKTSGQPPQEDIYWQGSNGDLWETSWVPSAGSGGTRYGPADLGIAV
jgi:hypothetical protein